MYCGQVGAQHATSSTHTRRNNGAFGGQNPVSGRTDWRQDHTRYPTDNGAVFRNTLRRPHLRRLRKELPPPALSGCMQLQARPVSVLADLPKTVSPKTANVLALTCTSFFPPAQTVKHAAMARPLDGRSVFAIHAPASSTQGEGTGTQPPTPLRTDAAGARSHSHLNVKASASEAHLDAQRFATGSGATSRSVSTDDCLVWR
jgi:hypothetical protein